MADTVVTLTTEKFYWGTPIGTTVRNQMYGPDRHVLDSPNDTSGVFTPGDYKVTNLHKSRSHIDAETGKVWRGWGQGLTYLQKYEGRFPAAAFSSIQAPNSGIIADAINEVLLKCKAKVGASQLELGTEIGELKETVEFLIKPFSSIRELLSDPVKLKYLYRYLTWESSHLSRGRKRVLQKDLSAIPSTWMEVRYALMPLLRSIKDIYDVLYGGLRDFDLDQLYAARSSLQVTERVTQEINHGSFINHVDLTYTHYVRGFMHYRYNEKPTSVELLGLSPEYFPETVWNLIPLSFVLDWAFNFGIVVASLRFSPKLSILGNCVGVKTIASGTITTEMPRNTTIKWNGDPGKGTYHREEYQRHANVSHTSLPSIKSNIRLGPAKLLDLLIIGKQILERRKS